MSMGVMKSPMMMVGMSVKRKCRCGQSVLQSGIKEQRSDKRMPTPPLFVVRVGSVEGRGIRVLQSRLCQRVSTMLQLGPERIGYYEK